jgi:phage terminase large subunit
MKYSFIAVDYGSDHPTAILLISRNWTSQYIVTKELKLERTAVSDIVIKIGDFIEFLHDQGCANKCIYVDPAAATLKDELRKSGLSSINAMNSHDDGIGCVRNMLALDQLFIFSNCENLIDEMYAYSFKDNNSGKDEVIKLGDDFCDALRYGVYTDSVIGGANE